MADPKVKPKTLDEVELPETRGYRVAMMGVSYNLAIPVYGPTGPTLAFANEVGRRGDVIQLDEAQAQRLLSLGAVKEADSEKSYDELSDSELQQLVRRRGVNVVVGQSPNALGTTNLRGIPLRDDLIGALQAYDAGVTSIAPVQEGPLAAPTPAPDPGQNPGPGNDAPTSAPGRTPGDDSGGSGEVSEKVRNAPEATDSNVAALAEYLKAETPNADETVAIAGDTVEGARAVLDAERLATGDDPRVTVARRLQKIIDDADDGNGE